VTNLKASTSRRWHFCLLKTQKPAHPVGSLGSRGRLHIGTCSPKIATHTSSSKQSSQYLVALTFWLVVSVSAPSLNGVVLSGNDRLSLKEAPMTPLSPSNASLVNIPAIIDVNVVISAVAVVRFDSSFEFVGVIGSPEVTFCPVNLLVDDFRYCWMIWSFSGSERKETWCDQSSREKAYYIFATTEVRIKCFKNAVKTSRNALYSFSTISITISKK